MKPLSACPAPSGKHGAQKEGHEGTSPPSIIQADMVTWYFSPCYLSTWVCKKEGGDIAFALP